MGIFSIFKPNVEKMEAKREVKGLIKALKHKNRGVREKAAEALGRIGDERAVEPLIQALNDENRDVRRKAAYALGKIGDKRAVEPLIRALKDEDWWFREYVIEALGEIKDARAVEPLVQALKVAESTRERKYIVEALDKLGWKPKDSMEIADYLIGKGDWDSRYQFLELVLELEEEYLVRLLYKPFVVDEEFLKVVIKELGKRRSAKAVEPLIRISLNGLLPDYLRECAIRALGEIKDKRAVEPLIQILDLNKRISKEVRDAAMEALIEIGDKKAANAVLMWLLQNNYICTIYYEKLKELKKLGFQTMKCLSKRIERLKNLFDDYAEPIAKVTTVFEVRYYEADFIDDIPPIRNYTYDLDIAEEGVKQLCEIRTHISNNIIYLVSQMGDTKVRVREQDIMGYVDTIYDVLNREKLRKLAREELKRRGNPVYDPSVFLNEGAWKL